jgi:hypothetical protein
MDYFGRDPLRSGTVDDEPGGGSRQPRSRWTRFLTYAASIATILAGIPVILAVWPDPDPDDGARFRSIQHRMNVALSQYEQRKSRPHAVGLPRPPAAVRMAAPSGDPSAVADSPEPVEPSASSTGRPPGQDDPEIVARVRKVCPSYLPRSECTRFTTGWMANEIQGAETSGKSPARAARDVADVLKNARKTAHKSGRRRETLGVVVAVEVELRGLRGRPALIYWTMWPATGETSLPEQWQRQFLADRLTASSVRDTAATDFWVPLPKRHGRYFVEVTVVVDGAVKASADSETFR